MSFSGVDALIVTELRIVNELKIKAAKMRAEKTRLFLIVDIQEPSPNIDNHLCHYTNLIPINLKIRVVEDAIIENLSFCDIL